MVKDTYKIHFGVIHFRAVLQFDNSVGGTKNLETVRYTHQGPSEESAIEFFEGQAERSGGKVLSVYKVVETKIK